MYIDKKYLYLDDNDVQRIKLKKITGHRFVDLLGLNKFKLIGDALLEICSLIPSDKIDPKWLKRGDFAEKLIKKVYERDGHKCTVYDKKAINYDNFDYQWLGGLIDIELLEEKTLIEVKSKSMKDYDYITKNLPKAEIYQGLFYGRLRNYKTITMEWVFFDKPTEDEIFLDLPPTTLKNLKHVKGIYEVNEEEINSKIEIVQNLVNNFMSTKKVALDIVSDKVLEYLKTSGIIEIPEPPKFDEHINQSLINIQKQKNKEVNEVAIDYIEQGKKFKINVVRRGITNGRKWLMLVSRVNVKNPDGGFTKKAEYVLFPENNVEVESKGTVFIDSIKRVKTEMEFYNGEHYPKTTIVCTVSLTPNETSEELAKQEEYNMYNRTMPVEVEQPFAEDKKEEEYTVEENNFDAGEDEEIPF